MVNKLKTLIEDEDSGLGPDGLPPEDAVTKKEAAAEPEFTVEVEEDDAPAEKPGVRAELSEYKQSKDDEYENLKKQVEEERQMRLQIQQEQEEAMRYAQAAHEENKRLKNVLSEGATLYNDTVKSKLDTELSQAQRAYKEAYESGDSDGMVEAQMKMAELVSEKREFSRRPPLQQAEDVVYNNQAPVASSPSVQPAVPKADPKAEAWFQKNNAWFGVDDEMTAIAYATDKKLIREGIDPRTDEYYRRLDLRLREMFPEKFEDAPRKENQNRQRSTVVAPASRSPSSKTIKVPPGGAAVARRLGVPLEEYAKQWEAVNGRG
jgi:DNA-binding transcriptional regulator YbjK